MNIQTLMLKKFALKLIDAAAEKLNKTVTFISAEIFYTGAMACDIYGDPDENGNEILLETAKTVMLSESELDQLSDVFKLNGVPEFTLNDKTKMIFTFSKKTVLLEIETLELTADMSKDWKQLFSNIIKF